MREIKFRAWDVLNGEMIYSDKEEDDYGFRLDNGVVKSYIECVTVDVCGDEYIDYDYIENIMQYTGLKDKNGVEIYEGDIIQTKDFYECGELIFKGKKQIVKNIDCYLETNLFIDISGEVIGNICENKYLLDDEKINYLK